MISYFPSPRWQQPRCWSTEPRMWKNWLTLSSSLSPHREFSFVKATRTNRDWDERSPGSPRAPMPRLYCGSDRPGPKVASTGSGERWR